MAKDNKQILDIDKEIFIDVLTKSKSYKEATSLLNICYCSAAITRIRQAANIYDIDISHLDKKSKKTVVEVKKLLDNKYKRRHELNKKLRRGSIEDYCYSIFYDSRGNDKKNNRDNNLTVQFIKEKLSVGVCSYCNSNEYKLTLDRIDNKIGHTVDNVVVACVLCNLIRNSMPYEAWLHIVPSVRSAKELGLFDSWYNPFGRTKLMKREL